MTEGRVSHDQAEYQILSIMALTYVHTNGRLSVTFAARGVALLAEF